MRASLLVLSLVLLAGCCTPKTIEVTKEVRVPVITKCNITVPDKPVMPFETSPLGEDIYVKTQKMLSEIKYRKAYELKLETAITECNK